MTVTVCGRGIRASSRARFRERARAAACRRVQLWRRLSNWSDEVCVETDYEDESAPDDVICKPRFLGSHKLHYGEVRLCPLLFIQRKCWPFSFVLYDQREHSPATGTVETAERALIGNDWNSSRRCARLLFQSGTLFDAAKSDLQWAISVQSLRSQPRRPRAPTCPLRAPCTAEFSGVFFPFDDVDALAQQRAPSDAFDSARSAIFDANACGVALDATLPSPFSPARTNLARLAEEFAHETSTRVVRSYLHPADLPSSSGPTDERRVPASTSRRATSDPRDFPPDVSR